MVRFGVFEANLATGEIWKQGRKVKLQGQPFQVLKLLLRQPGGLVSREEFQREIWPDEAHGDFDQGVNTAVRKIRMALGDSADNPRFIETLPRKGYRFIAPVTCAESGQAEAVVVVPLAKPVRPVLRGLAVVAVLGGAAVGLMMSSSRGVPVNATVMPLTAYQGLEREPSFSPSGDQVAFIWNGKDEDNFDVYLKAVGGETATRLTFDARNDFAPAWSPDGRMIAFGRNLDATTVGIFVVLVTGGSEAKVLEQRRVRPEQPYYPFVSWSPDGKWLAVSDIDPDSTAETAMLSLFLVSVETGERRQLTKMRGGFRWDFAPVFSPDGRFLAFFRAVHETGRSLFVLPLTQDLRPAGDPFKVGNGHARALSLAWFPTSNELLMTAATEYGNRSEFWIVDANRGSTRRAPFQTRYSESVAVSRSGRIAYSDVAADKNIWKLDLDLEGRPAGQPRPFIASTRDDQNPKYSPDGKQLVFTSNRGGSLEVWTCQSDGSNPRQLTNMGEGTTGAPRWSPDGSRIIFDSNKGGGFDLYSILAAGGAPHRLTNNAGADALGSFSADGRTIYFMSSVSGGPEIWKMPAGGGTAVRITKRGGRYAIESPDRGFLYYSKEGTQEHRFSGGGIWRVPVSGGEEVRIVPSVTFQNFALTRGGIYYIPDVDTENGGSMFNALRNTKRSCSIHYLDYDSEVSRRVIDISGRPTTGITVSPDGRTLLFSQIDQISSDLMLVHDLDHVGNGPGAARSQ